MRTFAWLSMLMATISIALAGNGFTAAVDNTWSNPGNWSMGVVPEDATTNPGSYVPQWGNDVGFYSSNVAMVIGDGESHASYSFQLGAYGAANTSLTMTGGELTVGPWGLNVGRGGDNSAHAGSYGFLKMTGGVINVNAGIEIPEQWTAFPGIVKGRFEMYDGVVNANYINLGKNNGGVVETGVLELFGGVINLSGRIYMSGGGMINITDGMLVTGGDDRTIFQTYIDNNWIKAFSGAGNVYMEYNPDDNKTYVTGVIPEPMTLSLLALGAVCAMRRRMR